MNQERQTAEIWCNYLHESCCSPQLLRVLINRLELKKSLFLGHLYIPVSFTLSILLLRSMMHLLETEFAYQVP